MTYVHVYIIILLNIAISIIKEYESEVREKKLVNETIFVILSLRHMYMFSFQYHESNLFTIWHAMSHLDFEHVCCSVCMRLQVGGRRMWVKSIKWIGVRLELYFMSNMIHVTGRPWTITIISSWYISNCWKSDVNS